jgi:AraC-like DNA-binding protein
MKVVQFTIPVVKESAILVQEEELPYFYNHLHRHNETQITWIIKGAGTLIAGNYMQPFKSGDVYIIGANQPHIFKNDKSYFLKNSKQSVKAITVFFDPKVLAQTILQLPETKAIKKFIDITAYGLQVPANKQQLITDEMLLVQSLKTGHKIAAFLRLLQLLADIKNWNSLATITPENSFTDNEGLRMNNIYQYTMANYAEQVKLKEIADIAFMSPQAFCRYFKKHTRKTYFDFLNEVRINEACQKIVTGSFDSISSIALDTGFNSTANFCRVFKKVTQQSPLQYRKMYEDNTGEK